MARRRFAQSVEVGTVKGGRRTGRGQGCNLLQGLLANIARHGAGIRPTQEALLGGVDDGYCAGVRGRWGVVGDTEASRSAAAHCSPVAIVVAIVATATGDCCDGQAEVTEICTQGNSNLQGVELILCITCSADDVNGGAAPVQGGEAGPISGRPSGHLATQKLGPGLCPSNPNQSPVGSSAGEAWLAGTGRRQGCKLDAFVRPA